MGFLKSSDRAVKKDAKIRSPRKKRAWKIISLILGIIFISIAAFLSYIYATGSKVFDNGITGGSSFVKAITGEKLKGEEDGRVNILLMGRGGENHPGGLLTDSLEIVSINTKDKKVAMISVPRDLLADIKDHGQDKINTAFADGYNDYLSKNCRKKNQNDCRDSAIEAGSQKTTETISNVLNLPIQYYVMIDFEGFKQIVDKIGGLDIYVDKAIYDPLYPDKNMKGYEPFSIKAGQQHLNGETALKYSRSRETSSDFDRSRRQQQVIAAIKSQTLKAGILANPKKILDLVTIVGNHIRTNFTPSEIKLAADMIKDVNQDGIITKVLSSAADGYLVDDSSTGTYYLRPRGGSFDKLQNMIKNIFSPVDESNQSAEIEVLNASKTPGSATKAAALIKNSSYEVVSIQNSTERLSKTVIYDYSGGKKQAAVDYLKNKFGAEVQKKTKNVGSEVDISLLIGDDFNTRSTASSEVSKR